MMRVRWALGALLLGLPACSAPSAPTVAAAPAPAPCTQTGAASWYHPGAAAHATASGQKPDAGELVAAHPTLPFGTQVTVTELASGRSVVVRVADRGPFTKGRIIDLSPAAAARLGIRQEGVAQVRLEITQASSAAPGVTPAASTGAKCPFVQDTAA